MRAFLRINALLRQNQPLHRHSADNVRFNDLVDIFRLHASVPNRIGIDDYRLPVLALIKTSGFIRAHFALQPALGDLVFEYFLELALTVRIAASPRTTGIALVSTYKDVSLKLRHIINFNQYK